MTKVRVPFLVSVGERLYVHFSEVPQGHAKAAFRGMMRPVRKQIVQEVRKTDGTGWVEIHGMLPWGDTLNTISLSEFNLTKTSLEG